MLFPEKKYANILRVGGPEDGFVLKYRARQTSTADCPSDLHGQQPDTTSGHIKRCLETMLH
jgi:hypothetical protein